MSSSHQESEVAIISAFGRGELLAGELKTRGLNVVLVDVSDALGVRSPADLEGPFPIVRPNPLLPVHLEWLMTHSFEEVTNGACLWLPEGPVEFRGTLSQFYGSSRPDVAFFRDHFSDLGLTAGKGTDVFNRSVPTPFDQSWIAEFAFSFCSNALSESTECHRHGEPFPFTQIIHVPIFRTDRMEKVQEDLKATGVHWLKADGLGDVELERGRVVGLDIRTETLRSRNFVWCLSSEETHSLSRSLARRLFPRGIATAKWVWRRFQVHSPKTALDNTVPPYVVMIDDKYFPWAFDNVIVLKRRKPGLSDIWVRLPSENSRKPDQLKKFTKKLEEKLNDRFRGLQHEIEPFWDENPPLYPVFETEQLRSFAKPSFANLFFEGPEVLSRQDWAGRFQTQVTTMLAIMAKRKKEKGDDTALHAP